jgi:hypothetical protein
VKKIVFEGPRSLFSRLRVSFRKGLVRRIEDIKDRRKLEIQLMAKRKTLYEKTRQQYRELLRKSFSVLTTEEATKLLHLLKKIKNEISQEGIRVATNARPDA